MHISTYVQCMHEQCMYWHKSISIPMCIYGTIATSDAATTCPHKRPCLWDGGVHIGDFMMNSHLQVFSLNLLLKNGFPPLLIHIKSTLYKFLKITRDKFYMNFISTDPCIGRLDNFIWARLINDETYFHCIGIVHKPVRTNGQ